MQVQASGVSAVFGSAGLCLTSLFARLAASPCLLRARFFASSEQRSSAEGGKGREGGTRA